ncbi:glycosyltransferase family 2 protein [Lutibacter maritimus]|uniref:Glycosyl transferase family 2 n=1 Tax=Lutibacter maritimus TaxID=593133 RepID=A0A1I6SNL1_9FLAO|nr:glycosyltransferase family A protein [Lutibacter maritimus]SFS78543.1 Glycosyl transferase family 2 [Lutibacter maritimus]
MVISKDFLVTVIIPTFNRVNLIKETLDSVLNQTYKNWECIIIDDRSTDGTLDVLRYYQKKDDRFKIIIKPIQFMQSASISRNIGLNNAQGDYIQFLDSDDLLAANKIESQINLLKNEDSLSIATCKWGKFNSSPASSQLYESKEDYKDFNSLKEYFDLIGIIGGFFPPHNFLLSKALINKSGYWNENLIMNDDGEFFFRIFMNAEKIIFDKNTHVWYRTHSNDNISLLNSIEKANSLLNSWKLIELMFLIKYNEISSNYVSKKKEAVYNELKKTYPILISKNKLFFKEQIKNDNFMLRLKKIKKRFEHKLSKYK